MRREGGLGAFQSLSFSLTTLEQRQGQAKATLRAKPTEKQMQNSTSALWQADLVHNGTFSAKGDHRKFCLSYQASGTGPEITSNFYTTGKN